MELDYVNEQQSFDDKIMFLFKTPAAFKKMQSLIVILEGNQMFFEFPAID
jgi:hypothetical protein